jgi:hypothetical protein
MKKILIIRERGHLIEIPGMAPFRTPAKVDISKGDIIMIIGYLKVCDITDFEIIASNKGLKERYTAKDFNTEDVKKSVKKKKKKPDKVLENRIDRLEKIMNTASEKSKDDSSKKVEQTTNQMEQFQKRVLDAIQNINIKNINPKSVMDELEDEMEPFIPEIDIKGMTLKGGGEHKTIKEDKSGRDDAADALSKLLNK